MGRRKKIVDAPQITEQEKSVVEQLAAKMQLFENQLKEKDAKIDLMEKKQELSGIGSQTYGLSDWKSWQSGSDKGYCRSLYVDIRTMLMPRAY